MKTINLRILTIALIVAVVAIAGCASNNNTANTTSNNVSSSTTVSSQQMGSTVDSTSVFSTNYKWIEYQIATDRGGNNTTADTRIERSIDNYNGTPAVHLKLNASTASGGNVVSDIYYDKDQNSVLGGTMTITYNGQTMTRQIPPTQLSGQGFNNFNEKASLTYDGTESVTVPAGTYASASKYNRVANGTSVTYWASSGVPVPVKEVTSSPRGSSTLELVGWG
jgi:hypothetical protein